MGEWDLTKRKRASRKNRIVKCPVCGEYGQVAIFVDHGRTPKFAGTVSHKGHTYSAGIFEGNMIDESCILTEAQAVEIEAWLANEEVE
jgi:hypothetical protein